MRRRRGGAAHPTPADGRELAGAIEGAALVMIPECGHMLTTGARGAVARAVLAHL